METARSTLLNQLDRMGAPRRHDFVRRPLEALLALGARATFALRRVTNLIHWRQLFQAAEAKNLQKFARRPVQKRAALTPRSVRRYAISRVPSTRAGFRRTGRPESPRPRPVWPAADRPPPPAFPGPAPKAAGRRPAPAIFASQSANCGRVISSTPWATSTGTMALPRRLQPPAQFADQGPRLRSVGQIRPARPVFA